MDIGGKDSAGIVTYLMNLYLHKNLENVTYMQQYFQKLRLLNDLDENDGKAMAEALVSPYNEKEKQEAKDSTHDKADLEFIPFSLLT